MQGGCSKEKDLGKRLQEFLSDADMYAKFGDKHPESKDGVISMKKIKPQFTLPVVACEVTVAMASTAWKQRAHVIRKRADGPLWLVDYAGYEPAFSKYEKAVAKSLQSFRLPK